MKRLHLIGDSHLNQIWAAWRRLAEKFQPLTFGSDCFIVHGANFFEFEITRTGNNIRVYSNRVAEALPNHPEYTNSALDYDINRPEDVYVLASPLHSAQIFRHPSWNSYCPWSCAIANPDLQAVSESVLLAWFDSHLRCRMKLIETMKQCGNRLAVVEPPKPLLRTLQMFGLRRDIVVSTDQLYRNYVKNRLKELDVPVIEVPIHTFCDGFTLEEYSYPMPTDPHHGNFLFGAEMMIRILEFGVETIGTPGDHASLEAFQAGAGRALESIFSSSVA